MMMTASNILDSLLGLRALSFSDSAATLQWAHPLPPWGWAGVVLGVWVLAGWSYSRLLGSRGMRIGLVAVRGSLLFLLVVLLCGPQWVRTDEHVELDSLIMLVDRSASLSIADLTDDAGESATRDAVLRRAIDRQRSQLQQLTLADQHRLVWFGFASQIQPIGEDTSQWGDAQVQATAIRTAIEQVLDDTAGQPISSIVLFSDGQTPQSTGGDLVQRLNRRGVPVFVVPLGSQTLPLDLSIAHVNAPSRAFSGDIVPVTVQVEQIGGEAGDARHARVRLVDANNDAILDETFGPLDIRKPIRLAGQSDRVGRVTWRVEVVYDPPAGSAPERMTDNNTLELSLELIDRPMRVLYIEGYPRWEYRYLKSLLVREKSIDSSILLLSADRRFAQEGDTPITRLPNEPDEMQPFDVIILGDVPADYFTTDQMMLVRDQVAVHGAGLLWIGGARSVPMQYDVSVLGDLLPMRHPAAVRLFVEDSQSLRLYPTRAAKALRVLEMHGPTVEEGWPTDLPSLRRVQRLGDLKPAVDVLATTSPPELMPLVVRMRYGAGQSLYIASDQTWRWRYGRGELYFEQFWLQLIRMLGRDRVQQAGDLATLRVSHGRVNVDDRVVVELQLHEISLIERKPQQVSVTISKTQGAGLPVDQLELQLVEDGDRVTYRTTWQPSRSGLLLLRVIEPILENLNLQSSIDVIALDDELRRIHPDHDRLARIAKATGGQVIPLDDLAMLVPLAPKRARITPNDIRETLWDSSLAFGMVMSLLVLEWLCRRAIRLM